jgi:hypothetical protein
MRSFLTALGLFLGLFVLSSVAPAQDEKPARKKDDARTRTATDQDYIALRFMKEVAGKLEDLTENKQLTLRVEYPTVVLKDPSEMKAPKGAGKQAQQQFKLQQQLIKEYNQIVKAKNPNQQFLRMQKFIARLQALQVADAQRQLNEALDPRNNPFKVVMTAVTLELPIADDVKVARVTLPIEYDDKGNVIEYKPEDLKKKKDPNMPGFTTSFEDVKVGQIVNVYLRRQKPADKNKDKEEGKDAAGEEAKEKAKDEAKAKEEGKAKAKEEGKDKAKEEGKDKAKEEGKDKAEPKAAAPPQIPRPQVRMILIITEPEPATVTKDRKSKKKQ